MLTNLFSRRRTGQANRKPFRPGLEALETRLALATFRWWEPVSGSFTDSGRWRDDLSRTGVPGPGDDARIRIVGADFTVSFAGTVTVKTLAVDHRLVMTSGTLSVANPEQQASAINRLDLRAGATLRVLRGQLDIQFANRTAHQHRGNPPR